MDHRKLLESFYPLQPGDIDLLMAKMKNRQFKKGEIIVAPGKVQDKLYFVNSGVQMSFFETEEKKKVIAFTYSPGLCAIPGSFSGQAPSEHFLTCLTDSDMDYIGFKDLQELLDRSHSLERVFRLMTEAVLSATIARYVALHTMTMEERYKAFCRRSPHLLQMVPHKYIASYLEIDPTNFSKLFNRVKF